MLSHDLAELYGVDTGALNRAVKRNLTRFLEGFMFQLNRQEVRNLKCQIGTSRRGGLRSLPYAFTEQGVAMLSNVFHSERAIKVNVAIMRTFARLRQILLSHGDLAQKLYLLEKKYDVQLKVVFDAIHQVTTPPEPKPGRLGFRSP